MPPLAASVVEYAWFLTAPGRELVVMVRTGVIVRVRVAERLCDGFPESVTDTERVKLPAADGVPVMAPVEALTVSPEGGPVADQE